MSNAEVQFDFVETPEETRVKLNQDLTRFLEATIRENDNKPRDIEIIRYYYGLGGGAGATLEETALQFDGAATPQRISQIIKRHFKDVARSSDVPSLAQIDTIIHQNRFWRGHDLHLRLANSGLISNVAEMNAYFKLLDDLGEQSVYDVYSPDLARSRNRNIAEPINQFVIDSPILPELKRLLGFAKRAPGQSGIADLYQLDVWRDSDEAEVYLPMLEALILDNPNAWSDQLDGELWYLFEDGQNRLKNYNRKVFSIAASCDLSRLSESYENAIPRGSAEIVYPPKSVITAYLRSSPDCEIIDGHVYYYGPTSPLTRIESDAVGFLAKHKETHYPPFRDALLAKKHNAPHVDKIVFYSPLVHVDKREDRKNFVYSFVGSSDKVLKPSRSTTSSADPRYLRFRQRLLAIKQTDRKDPQVQRVEQPILSDWLFENKESEHCGICGELFSLSALHAAHKKKRSLCNPDERRDPHIVMPMCVFGCDHLYENRFIRIKDGNVVSGLSPDIDGPEKQRIAQLVGRKIDDRWLEGPQSYFETPKC